MCNLYGSCIKIFYSIVTQYSNKIKKILPFFSCASSFLSGFPMVGLRYSIALREYAKTTTLSASSSHGGTL